ncbi:MAG: hypothetical protein JNL85_08575 [Rubrivivax sp.]|nr:hypothetical protein [Rubrivivax sp.]
MNTTRRVVALTAVGCILQLVFVLGWIALGKGDAPAWVKWGLVGFFVIASLIVIHKASSLLGWQALLLCCGCLAVTSVGIYQLLGFTIFPGLVKDVDLFSWGYLTRTLTILGLSFFGYAVLTLLARLAPRAARA